MSTKVTPAPVVVTDVARLLDLLATAPDGESVEARFAGLDFTVERTRSGEGHVLVEGYGALPYLAHLHSRIQVAQDLKFLAIAALTTNPLVAV